MGQQEVMQLLKKKGDKMSIIEIAKSLELSKESVRRTCKSLINTKEIKLKSIPTKFSRKKYLFYIK
jgi:response regulator of citrate/malate metabolism